MLDTHRVLGYRDRLPIRSVADSAAVDGMNGFLRAHAVLMVTLLRGLPWLAVVAGAIAGLGLLAGSDGLASVALVPVILLVALFLLAALTFVVGLVLAIAGRGRIPGPWRFPVQMIGLAYRRDARKPQR